MILVFNIILLFAGGCSIGISSDEPVHVRRLQSFFDFGWYLPGEALSNGEPSPSVPGTYVYGPVAALLTHLITFFQGADSFSHVSFESGAYASRHIGVVLLSVVGLLGIVGFTRLLLDSWKWGVLSAAILSSIPLWTGHAMFNIKDIPVATGYTLLTLGLLQVYRPVFSMTVRYILPCITLIISGVMLSVGTRPGMLFFVLASVLVAQTSSLYLQYSRLNKNADLRTCVIKICVVAVALAISFALLWLIYPKAFGNLVVLGLESAKGSVHYTVWNGGMLTAGYYHGQPPPWWYLPIWIIFQMPFGILVLAVLGITVTATRISKILRKPGSILRSQDGSIIGFLLLFTQAFVAPVAAVLLGSTIYNGTRQLLFMYPPLAVFAVTGVWFLFNSILLKRKR